MTFLETIQTIQDSLVEERRLKAEEEARRDAEIQTKRHNQTIINIKEMAALLGIEEEEYEIDVEAGCISVGEWLFEFKSHTWLDVDGDIFNNTRVPGIIVNRDKSSMSFDIRLYLHVDAGDMEALEAEANEINAHTPYDKPDKKLRCDMRFNLVEGQVSKGYMRKLAANMLSMKKQEILVVERIQEWCECVRQSIEDRKAVIANIDKQKQEKVQEAQEALIDTFKLLISRMDKEELLLAHSLLFTEIVDVKFRNEFDRYEY